MKKRLLALALCLVLAVSLLPVTAAAAGNPVDQVEITTNGVKRNADGTYDVDITGFKVKYNNGEIDSADSDYDVFGRLYTDSSLNIRLTAPPKDGATYYADCQIFVAISQDSIPDLDTNISGDDVTFDISGYEAKFDHAMSNPHAFGVVIRLTKEHKHDWGPWMSNGNGTHKHICTVAGCGASEIVDCVDANPVDCLCDDCGASIHNWNFKQTGNTLSAVCGRGDIDPLNLTLKADSVTLPDSPFNARLEGEEQFKKEVPNAVIGDLVYKYKGPNGWSVVEPTAANAKAGEYQVGVQITIPGNNSGDNVSGQSQGGEVYDLYVKYTAVDPKVTAQTGDNRPIELMIGSVLAFSALAAVAFVLDSKRKYSR